jgi:hypothetical protein
MPAAVCTSSPPVSLVPWAVRAVGKHDGAVAQRVARVEACLERREAEGLEREHRLHERPRDAREHAGRIDPGQQLVDAGRQGRQAVRTRRLHVDADADHGIARRRRAARARRLDQDARELAVVDPQIVRPLEFDQRMQLLGDGDTDRERQAGPIGWRQRQAERERQ